MSVNGVDYISRLNTKPLSAITSKLGIKDLCSVSQVSRRFFIHVLQEWSQPHHNTPANRAFVAKNYRCSTDLGEEVTR